MINHWSFTTKKTSYYNDLDTEDSVLHPESPMMMMMMMMMITLFTPENTAMHHNFILFSMLSLCLLNGKCKQTVTVFRSKYLGKPPLNFMQTSGLWITGIICVHLSQWRIPPWVQQTIVSSWTMRIGSGLTLRIGLGLSLGFRVSGLGLTPNSTNTFKVRLDKFWHNQEIIYDFRAQLQGTGSRSEVLCEEF